MAVTPVVNPTNNVVTYVGSPEPNMEAPKEGTQLVAQKWSAYAGPVLVLPSTPANSVGIENATLLNSTTGAISQKIEGVWTATGTTVLVSGAASYVASFAGGTTGLLPAAASTGAITLTGTLVPGNGGTGLTSFTTNGALYATSTSALTSGTLPLASGGTGVTTVPTNGQLLIGNGTGYTVAGLTAGSGITITPGPGSIQISASASGVTTFSGGTTGLTPASPTSGAISLAGTLATANGGTGLTGFTAANNAIYSSSASALTAGTLPVAAGGTGLTTATAANNAIYSTGATTLTAGTLPVAAGGTGQTSYTDGQLLIGNSTGNTLAKGTLTAGTGISVTNGGGSITLAKSSTPVTLSSGNANSGTTVTITGTAGGNITDTYSYLVLQLTGISFTANAVALQLRLSTDGTTYDSTAGNYRGIYTSIDSTPTVSQVAISTATVIGGFSNGASGDNTDYVITFSPYQGGTYTQWVLTAYNNVGLITFTCSGFYKSTTSIKKMQLSGGTFDGSGTYTLIGVP